MSRNVKVGKIKHLFHISLECQIQVYPILEILSDGLTITDLRLPLAVLKRV